MVNAEDKLAHLEQSSSGEDERWDRLKARLGCRRKKTSSTKSTSAKEPLLKETRKIDFSNKTIEEMEEILPFLEPEHKKLAVQELRRRLRRQRENDEGCGSQEVPRTRQEGKKPAPVLRAEREERRQLLYDAQCNANGVLIPGRACYPRTAAHENCPHY